MYDQSTLQLKDINQFSKLFLDYIGGNKELEKFYNAYPSLENFKKVISARKFPNSNREILAQSLHNQYHKTNASREVSDNIDLFKKDTTFTVTTGHQLCLFTGPLYVIYKIVTTINLAKELKKSYPEYDFVPVYWMATEDHDFEEINHFYLFNKKYQWQSEQKGAVGRFETEGLRQIFSELTDKLPQFEKAYLENKNLSEATRCLVNDLFGKYGLVVVDGDDEPLKGIFTPHIKADIFKNTANQTVEKSDKALKNLGYDPQINARPINFFYLSDNVRERIVLDKEIFKVLNTDLKFTKEELEKLINEHPEKFSPNVVLRPLYQEVILPNIAYIGGPSEVIYWLQLKDLFDVSSVNFPLLFPRNFALVVNRLTAEKVRKLNLTILELFKNEKDLKETFLKKNSSLSFDISKYEPLINDTFDLMKSHIGGIDKSLEGFTEAQRNEVKKVLENISKKLKKTIEMKEEEGIKQLLALHNRLFPGGELQERQDNFLNFYLNNPDFIETLLQKLKPLDFSFNILSEV
jgi:bacillithiol biosynthesis cysteine-adding enzyme BshC